MNLLVNTQRPTSPDQASVQGPDMEAGYVFPLALWTIAVIAVLLAAAYTVLAAANANLQRLVDREAAVEDFENAEMLMIELLLTEPMGLVNLRIGGQLNLDPVSGGFGEGGEPLSAVGEPHRVVGANGPVIVRLIAANGLIDLGEEPAAASMALLLSLGHSRAEAERLAATLLDYIDEDDLRRLGGAERDDYPEGETPRNAPLSAASEACGALGWREAVSLCRDPRLMDLYAFAGAPAAMSPRLAPNHLLQRLLVDERAVERALDALDDRTGLVRYSDFGLEGFDGLEDNSALPGPSFLIATHRQDARLVRLTRIDLTMASLYKPYQIAFSYLIGGPEIEGAFHVDDFDAVADLPQAR